MTIVVLLIVYTVITSAAMYGSIVLEEYMEDTCKSWDANHERGVACAMFWPVAGLPYVAYAAAVWHTSHRR